jgi:hypothetical protein
METKTQYIKRLRTALTVVGKEIEQKIVQLDRISTEIKRGSEELENRLADKQALTQAKLSESQMSGDEVWHLIWDNVWNAVKELKLKGSTNIKHNYEELESSLQAKQSLVQLQTKISRMAGDEAWISVWNVVWNVLWSVIEGFNRQAALEVKKVGDELQALLDKQLALQTELHEVLMSEDAFYEVLKGTTSAMIDGTSD